jgi:hypothetical protein
LRWKMCIHHCIIRSPLARNQTKIQWLSLPGYNCSGRFGRFGAFPKGPWATTWWIDPTTSYHFMGHTTDAERISAGAVGRRLESVLSGEATTLLPLPNMRRHTLLGKYRRRARKVLPSTTQVALSVQPLATLEGDNKGPERHNASEDSHSHKGGYYPPSS